jgi:hypothetical protein
MGISQHGLLRFISRYDINGAVERGRKFGLTVLRARTEATLMDSVNDG